jgi:hypothetical protein
MKTLSTLVKETNISIEDFLKDPAAAAERYVRAGMEEGIQASSECTPARSIILEPIPGRGKTLLGSIGKRPKIMVSKQSILSLLNAIHR